MLKGYDENGELRNVKVTKDGEVLMKVAGSGESGLDVNISNASELASDVEKETTLYAGVSTVGTEEITIGVNEEVSEISIANYSENANVLVSVDQTNFVIAPGLAMDLPINRNVVIIGLSATESDTKVQYVIKGKINSESEYNAFINPLYEQYDGNNISSHLTKIPTLDTSKINTLAGLFKGCSALTTIPLFDTSTITSMEETFSGCKTLKTIPSFDTSNVTNMIRTFYGCKSLTKIPLLNTKNVRKMENTFQSCTALTTIPLLDTSSVTSMKQAFLGCTALSDNSLNNILKMCANATSYTETKTLYGLMLKQEQIQRCTELENWTLAQQAGWTTGL